MCAPTGQSSQRLPLRAFGVAVATVVTLAGCATLSSLAALAQVRFELDRVSRISLAGVDLLAVRGYEDLGAMDIARVGLALAQGSMPLALTLEIGASNPDGNPEARLLELDWELFLDGRRTVGGGLPAAVVLPAGAVTPVPLEVELDLLEFFDGSARDLVNLAAGLAGLGGEPVAIRLEAIPTVDTPLGPIRYPRPVVLGDRGSDDPEL
jgi:hypothetical protein